MIKNIHVSFIKLSIWKLNWNSYEHDLYDNGHKKSIVDDSGHEGEWDTVLYYDFKIESNDSIE